MSEGGRLRAIPWSDVGIAVAAVVAVFGIAGVFTTAVDLAGLLGSQTRVIIAAAGVATGTVVARSWVNTEPGGYEPPVRERVVPVPVPGGDVDDLFALGDAAGTPEATRFYRSQARDRLQAIAIEVLCTHRGLSVEEAREQLRDGTWTDDEVAASLFVLRMDGGVSDEVAGVVRRSVGGEHPQVRRARRALAELERIAEVDG